MSWRLARRCCQGLLLLASCALPAVFAYNAPGKRWANGSTTFYAGVPGKAASGTLFAAAFEKAMQLWTDNTDFDFIVNRNYADPCAGYSRSTDGSKYPSGNGDQKNGADFRSDLCGNAMEQAVLATTLSSTQLGPFGFDYLTETDIVFNDFYTWDVYDGQRKPNPDFGRVALHELGHALGLDHEATAKSIMALRISDLYQLQPDDKAGANVLYGPPTLCPITNLPLNGVIRASLGLPDCRIKDLFGGGTDDSFVDVYRLTLTAPARIVADMRSTQLDSVLVLTDANLNKLDIFDSYLGSCNAHIDKVLAAGEYLLLANTYVKPVKCGGNQGAYSLSITDGMQPVLGETLATSGAAPAATLITGGASADGGVSYQTSFTAQDSIDVSARIMLDPSQVGQKGKIYVLIQLSNGSQYSMNSSGQYVPYHGDVSQMSSYKSGALAAQESLTIARKLRAEGTALAGLSVAVYVGYMLDSQPGIIQYGGDPVRFSISR